MADGSRLAGRVAIVTGAASGIGEAITARFLSEGASVVGADRDEKRLAGAAFAENVRFRSTVAEVSDPSAAQKVTDLAVEAFGGVDILVNSAGIVRYANLFELSLDEWLEVQQVNSTGSFLFSQAAARAMTKSPIPEGTTKSIINLASIEGIAVLASSGHPQIHYNASKGSVRMLSKALAVELGPLKIRVNSICPGVTETPLTVGNLANEGRREWFLERTPLRRFGAPEDIASAALFLASEESSFITGIDLVIDGGYLTQ